MIELFPPPHFKHIGLSTLKDHLTRYELTSEQVSYELGVFICSHLQEAIELQNYIQQRALPILVQLGDEFKGQDMDHNGCSILYNQSMLVLRQYAWYGEKNIYTTYPHLIQIPLGYMVGMLGNVKHLDTQEIVSKSENHNHLRYYSESMNSLFVAKKSLLQTSMNRIYNWSFIGHQHRSERKYAIQVFSTWNRYNLTNIADNRSVVDVLPLVMKEVYSQSKFVIVGLGRTTIDCFRIYEAIISGAIPIVVASQEDVDTAPGFGGYQPQLLYASTWEEALNRSKAMSDDEIDTKRKLLIEWYIDRLQDVRHKIRNIFNISSFH